MQFDEFWSRSVEFLRSDLAEVKPEREQRLFIPNWRPDRGFIDERFPIKEINDDKVTCLTIHAGKPVEIPRDDMAALYDMWDDYLTGQTPRIEIVEKVPRTTYAIALMKYLKDNVA